MKSKQEIIETNDNLASQRDKWRQKNSYYHTKQEDLISFNIGTDASILDIGCSTGELLVNLQPNRGIGIDISPGMIACAQGKYSPNDHPGITFQVDDIETLSLNDTFDYVVIADSIGEFTDIWLAFRNLHKVTTCESRIIITYYNAIWEPVLMLGEQIGLKMPQSNQNWLSLTDLVNLLTVNGFEVINQNKHLLMPKWIPVISWIFNNFLAQLPILRNLCLMTHIVARPALHFLDATQSYSVSVIVPCRNEKGNIRAAVERIPDMGHHTEIIFVDGNSNDGTVSKIEEMIDEYQGKKDIKLVHQVPPGSADGEGHGKMLKLGKGDAVRKGFAAATGDILMILDADLTVPPEDLPKFYAALAEGRGEFINGTRLVYPMEKEAMRFLNKLANKFFSMLFTWILGQQVKDTLCGTKVLFKRDYEKIVTNRSFFGDFDPFGDFDLLFGAAKASLKIVEIPIRYRERTYGEIKIERFKHGILLLQMSWLALKKFKLR